MMQNKIIFTNLGFLYWDTTVRKTGQIVSETAKWLVWEFWQDTPVREEGGKETGWGGEEAGKV